MIENGKIEIHRESKSLTEDITKEEFVYNHQEAIKGATDGNYYCTVNIDIPNTYLQSILDLFEADHYRYADGHTHSNEDICRISETNGIIIEYKFREVNLYVRKLYIKDGDHVIIIRKDDNIINVLKGDQDSYECNLQ